MKEHEFLPANMHGMSFCRHCGAKKIPGSTQTCLERAETVAPDRPRRVMAVDDIDTIHSRLTEIRREEDEARNTSSPDALSVSYIDEMDLLCG
jgi:hypothetical protein